MTITYELKDNLYINLTNKCSNSCDFCVRNTEGAFSHDLWLFKEPTKEEVIEDIFSRDLKNINKLCFVGLEKRLFQQFWILLKSARI